ncbi:UNVERIFIED_CONTAM: hypothetical protein FKN15_072077 [Acipenser sinensis]
MNTRCPPKRVPSAARFFTLCRFTVQPPQSYSIGGQRSSGQVTGEITCGFNCGEWFCEGKELENSPDIQILNTGELHTLIIAEAFEEDTGRYSCFASNFYGTDSTSAEIYIEGASSSESEGEPNFDNIEEIQENTSVSLTVLPPPASAEDIHQDASPVCSTPVQSLSQLPTQQPGSPTPYFTLASSASDTVLPPTRPPERITKPVLMGRAVSQGPPLSHSERGKAHTPSSPPLRVIAMTDRRIPRDCCPLPAVIRMCQTVSPDLPCYTVL